MYLCVCARVSCRLSPSPLPDCLVSSRLVGSSSGSLCETLCVWLCVSVCVTAVASGGVMQCTDSSTQWLCVAVILPMCLCASTHIAIGG